MSDHKPCGPECGDTICTECVIAYTYLDERNKEKERIVAIINRVREAHVMSKYNRERYDAFSISTTYLIGQLDSILAEIQNG